uniref:ABC transporter domain-containing protein n=1 Tax=Corethron hystrix TaxID=216773 RepID=A0A7S1B7A2_9STRA
MDVVESEEIDYMDMVKSKVEDSKSKVHQDEAKEEEVFYGAPDDAAWTDKSAAILLAEKMALETNEDSRELTHGPDGKKLSNKERKKKLKELEQRRRQMEYEVAAAQASAEGAQFACSQTAFDSNDPTWNNSLDIKVPSFNISAAGKVLFRDATLNISHGRRYGLVGPNGRGKSTLLKMIASRDLVLPPRIDFLYVEQEVVADDTPAVEAVLKADKLRWNLLEEEKKLAAGVDAGDENPRTFARLQEIYDQLAAIGSDAAESKARKILYGLGFDIEMQTKPTKMFSGGWRMRISLARALFIEPTLLMLDEPTNHLDLNAVIWLDDYLQKWKKTLFIVSHDQDFLNSVTQEILHIEELKLVSYRGNYDSFKVLEAQKRKQQQVAWEKQQKQIAALKRKGNSKTKAIEQAKKNPKRELTGKAKKKRDSDIAAGAEAAEAAELIKRPKEYTVSLEFAEVAPLGRPVIEVTEVHFRYGPKYPVIFDKIDFGIDMDSRICVVGPNGAGKSTLLKLLTGEVRPTSGDLRINPRLRMGIYNQHFVDRLPMNKTPVEHLRDRFEDEDYQSVRNRLGKYGLEGHAHEVTMRDLSGGQKARVVFVELSLQRPHVLLLDEPTNNLDIETIDALSEAINVFNGGIVVVTHDARLIEDCELELWVVEKEGVTKWTEGFEDYKTTLLEEMERAMEKEAAERAEKLAAAAEVRAKKLAAKMEAMKISK